MTLNTVDAVDDGTATIQCIFSHPAIKPRSAVGQSKQACELIPPPTQPLCEVGATVRIIGRVESWRDTRQINLDDLGMRFNCLHY